MSSLPVSPDPGDGYGEAIAAELERHGVLLLSGEDFRRIEAWHAAGVPEWLAVETIAKVYDRERARRQCSDRRFCRPLRYYEPAILEAAENLREMEAPGARQLPSPCDAYTLHAAPGRPCLTCGWEERDHGDS